MSEISNHPCTEHQRNRSSLSESNSAGFVDSVILEKPLMTSNRRKHSLYGVCPRPKFGPKASLHQSQETFIPIQFPTEPMLRWESAPENVMVIKKAHDPSLDESFVQLVSWLIEERGFKVFLEKSIKKEEAIVGDERMQGMQDQLVYFDGEKIKNALDGFVDLVICAGGDGTLIYASSLFQWAVPPIIAFHFGSLGFLLPFDFQNFKEHIDFTLKGKDVSLVLRSRMIALLCTCTLENCMHWSLHSMEAEDHYLVLNEVVVDRGDSPYIVQLDLFVDDMLVTVVQGDGVIISTPTGSTAYSMAAGASMVHPNVPAIIITPVCPHSLSFRPIVLPSGVQIKIMISPDARNEAWVSFDGRKRQHLKFGQMLVINTAANPIPCVTYVDPAADWFNRLAGCLHWNVRKLQSSLHTYKSQSTSNQSTDKKGDDKAHEEKASNNASAKLNTDVRVIRKTDKLACNEDNNIINKNIHTYLINNADKNVKNDDDNGDNTIYDEVAIEKKISESNLHRFNRSCYRRNKNSYNIYHNNHHHYRHSRHRRHLQPFRLRSSSLTDIQLSFLDIQNKLSLEGTSKGSDVFEEDIEEVVLVNNKDVGGCIS